MEQIDPPASNSSIHHLKAKITQRTTEEHLYERLRQSQTSTSLNKWVCRAARTTSPTIEGGDPPKQDGALGRTFLWAPIRDSRGSVWIKHRSQYGGAR